MPKQELDFSVTFQDYNDICSDCTEHDKCHKDRNINYDKVTECKRELIEIGALKQGE